MFLIRYAYSSGKQTNIYVSLFARTNKLTLFNFQGVFKSRTFVEMSEESLSYILQSDKLKADESEVLNAVKEWCTVNAVSYTLNLALL